MNSLEPFAILIEAYRYVWGIRKEKEYAVIITQNSFLEDQSFNLHMFLNELTNDVTKRAYSLITALCAAVASGIFSMQFYSNAL